MPFSPRCFTTTLLLSPQQRPVNGRTPLPRNDLTGREPLHIVPCARTKTEKFMCISAPWPLGAFSLSKPCSCHVQFRPSTLILPPPPPTHVVPLNVRSLLVFGSPLLRCSSVAGGVWPSPSPAARPRRCVKAVLWFALDSSRIDRARYRSQQRAASL